MNYPSSDSLYELGIHFPSIFCVFDKKGNVLSPSESLLIALDLPLDQVKSKPIFDFLHPDDIHLCRSAIEKMKKGIPQIFFENRIIAKDKSIRWLSWISFFLPSTNSIVSICRDITSIKMQATAYFSQELKYRTIFEELPFGLIITDSEGWFIEANGFAMKLFQMGPNDNIKKRMSLRKWKLLNSSGEPIALKNFVVLQALKEKATLRNLELGFHNNSGSITWLDVMATPIKVKGYGLAIAFQDITYKKNAEDRIAHLAFHDQLTGLPNRSALLEKLSLTLQESKRLDTLVGILAIDLDNFLYINDSKGHDYGDELLKEVAVRLKNSCRNLDSVFRQGGDEFIAILPNLTDAKEAAVISETILDAMSRSFHIRGERFFCTASIGIAMSPTDGDETNQLLKNAGTSLYLAKESGKNTYQFFTKDLQDLIHSRLEIENSMRNSLSSDDFLLHFQPQINNRTGKVEGMEALIRWKHPQKGMIPPNTFIPIAEETGMIIPLGDMVLKKAMEAQKYWKENGYAKIRMSVNLSTIQFEHEKLTSSIFEYLHHYNLEPKYFEVEITESSLMHKPERAIAILKKLANEKIRSSIDDFGTGYSSLGYLKKFPISSLKIDRSFIMDIETDRDSRVIVQAVINLAHTLGLSVVAEGVELASQLHLMKEMDVDTIQGFFFSKPLPLEETLAYFKKHT